MSTELFVYILLGFVQGATAMWGGIVSARSLPAGRERTVHVAFFVVLFCVGMSLIVWSGGRAYHAQEANDKAQKKLQADLDAARGKLDQSLLAQEYMKGQLNSIGIIMGKLGDSGSPALKQLASAVEHMAQSNAQATAATNKQLCANTMDLIKRMHEFEYKRRLDAGQFIDRQMNAMRAARTEEEQRQVWQRETQELMQRSAYEQYEFRTSLLGEAIYLKDELLKRLPRRRNPQAGSGSLSRVCWRGQVLLQTQQII